jgi:drug/metabolite transporter (DMT)-like permease
MRASALSYRLAVVFVVVGMVMGIAMAISGDHSVFPAHAHLNLLGWVSLFLFGMYYERNPVLDTSRSAKWQVIVWSAATVVLTIGVALVHTGHDEAEPIAGIGSLAIVAAMLWFGWFVFRDTATDRLPRSPRATPAE